MRKVRAKVSNRAPTFHKGRIYTILDETDANYQIRIEGIGDIWLSKRGFSYQLLIPINTFKYGK